MKTRTIWILGLLAIAFTSAPTWAATVSLQELISTHGSLTFGDKKFADFSFSSASPTSILDPANIIVETIGGSGCALGLRFSGNIVANGALLDFGLFYTVETTSGLPLLSSIGQSFMLSSAGDGGFILIGETVFDEGFFAGKVIAQSSVGFADFVDPAPEAYNGDQLIINPPRSKVWVTKDLFLYPYNPQASVRLTKVDQLFCENTAPPILTCPPNFSIQCLPAPPANFAGGTVCGSPTVTSTDGLVVGGNCGGTIARTWKATDACGNQSECIQIITVKDTIPPVITGCPSTPINLGCNPTPPTCATVAGLGITASDLCSGSLTPACTAGLVVSTGCQRSQTFTLKATDACVNSATCSVTYTWTEDTTPPTLSCPGDIVVPTAQLIPCEGTVTFTVPASDNCGNATVVCRTNGVVVTSPAVFPGGGPPTLVTCIATDSCGNQTNCSFNVTVTCLSQNPPLAAIGDFVWLDLNQNGKQDNGELGVAGVTVKLFHCTEEPAMVLMATTNTDAAGFYLFTDLPADSYGVQFVVPSGYTFTVPDVSANTFDTVDSDADTATGLTGCYTLAPGETNKTVDAGLLRPCLPIFTAHKALADPAYGSTGNHALWLPGIGTDFEFIPDGSFVENADGSAQLTGTVKSQSNVNKGFTVAVTLGGRTIAPPPSSPKKELDDSAYSENGGPIVTASWHYYTTLTGTLTGLGVFSGTTLSITRAGPAFQVGFGANGKNLNFGASSWIAWTTPPNTANLPTTGQGDFNLDLGSDCAASAIGDFVWNDLDSDGRQDANEPGLPNVIVKLMTCGGSVVATTNTDANGFYLFTDRLPGIYKIMFVTPAGFVFSPANATSDNVDSDAIPATGVTACIALNPSEVNRTVDAGLYSAPPCSLSCPAGTGKVGDPYSSALVASGGTPPYTFSLTGGSLPPPLTLNATTGAIVGTPTSAGTFSFTAKVTTASGMATVNCSITITPAPQGCTLTICYYKNHSSAITPLPIYLGTMGGAKTLTVSSQQIGVNVLGQYYYGAPANGITKLYAQLLAAKLNGLRGANLSAVTTTISSADAFLATHNYLDWNTLSATEKNSVLAWHSALDNYNNGVTGPGHCGDKETARCLVATATPCPAQVKLCWKASHEATSYNVARSTTPNGPYTTIKTGLTGTNHTDSAVVNGTAYYYAISALKSGVEVTDSDEVYAIPAASLPSPWATKDVGSVVAEGGANYTNSVFSVSGSGTDIGSTADAFRYVYQQGNGDCTIVAKVLSLQNTHAEAKAGVMIRETLAANSKYAGIFVTPGAGVAFQSRATTGGATSKKSTAGIIAPYWVKVVRTGSTFTAYYSSNGSAFNWTSMGSVTVTMGTSVYIGLGVTSRKDGFLSTGTFNSVTATP